MGLGLVKGKFLPLKGLPGIQAPEAHEKVFRGESDGQKDQKTESLGKANTKGYKVVSARRKSVRLITRR